MSKLLFSEEECLKFIEKESGQVVIITDFAIKKLYALEFKKCLDDRGKKVHILSIPEGERSKTRETKAYLEDQLLDLECDRDWLIVAFGGGVVTDIAGFVAATYMRGIRYINIPTTLMGMVDAAIGGKTGVNHPKGKNLIGTVYPPLAIYIAPKFLDTLPPQEFTSGLMEIIKMGLICDQSLFHLLEETIHTWNPSENRLLLAKRDLDEDLLSNLIHTSIQHKENIVGQDLFDKGIRNILNFGHTFAHAIENLTDFSLTHGEALFMGLLAESYLSFHKSRLSKAELGRIERLFTKLQFPKEQVFRELREKDLYEEMRHDKKAKYSSPRVILLEEIGKVKSGFCHPVSREEVALAVDWVNNRISYALQSQTK